jgi:hypothetical protein
MKTILTLVILAPTLACAQAPQMIAPSGTLPTTVWTSTGTYIVVPNYSTGQPQAVVQVNRNTANTNTTKSVDSRGTKK